MKINVRICKLYIFSSHFARKISFLEWADNLFRIFQISYERSLTHFVANIPILNLLKTPENLWFCGVFRGCKMRTLARNGFMKYDLQKTFIILLCCFSFLLILVDWKFIREKEKLSWNIEYLWLNETYQPSKRPPHNSRRIVWACLTILWVWYLKG